MNPKISTDNSLGSLNKPHLSSPFLGRFCNNLIGNDKPIVNEFINEYIYARHYVSVLWHVCCIIIGWESYEICTKCRVIFDRRVTYIIITERPLTYFGFNDVVTESLQSCVIIIYNVTYNILPRRHQPYYNTLGGVIIKIWSGAKE